MIILLLVALLPPLYMMRLVYLKDKVEREPKSLIIKILILGAVMSFPVCLIESITTQFLSCIFDPSSLIYILIENFLCVALVEEGGKYFSARRVWKNPAFNYRFDGVVYCVAASLGFAALENVLYVTSMGLGVGIARALMSIPGHTVFGIYMGIYFGEARFQQSYGDMKACRRNLKYALVIPTIIHGCYDAFLSLNSDLFTLVFYIFLITMYVKTIRKIKKFQSADAGFGSVPAQ